MPVTIRSKEYEVGYGLHQIRIVFDAQPRSFSTTLQVDGLIVLDN